MSAIPCGARDEAEHRITARAIKSWAGDVNVQDLWRGRVMRAPTIAIIGSGSLASAVCRSLAHDGLATASSGVDVLVMARDATAATSICSVAGSLAALAGRPIRFRPVQADIGDAAGLADALRAGEPSGVVLCASFQSPWESLRAPSRWTAMLSKAGFGLSLPLQAVPAIGVGEAIAKACPGAWFVNTCFPDAVNPVLGHLGVPVTCGAGNVAMLGAAIACELGLSEPSRLKVLAHHLHLHAPVQGAEEAMAWVDDEPIDGVSALLRGLRAAPRAALGDLAGASAAQVATALATGGHLDAQLPGPLGLPGGYPVRIEAGTLTLRLPAAFTRADAVAFNQRAALHDGVVVADGRLTFSPQVSVELASELPSLAEGCAVADIAAACERLLELRSRLRQQVEPERRS